MAAGSKDLGKLFDLVSWVELEEGARHLSVLLDSEISVTDALRLVLEGHLKISVRLLSRVMVRTGATVPIDEAEWRSIPSLDGKGHIEHIVGTVMPGGERVIVYEDQLRTISDVWDLPMIGGEQIAVEERYERSLFRSAPTMVNLEGVFVTDSAGRYCQLQERFDQVDKTKPYDHPNNYYPAASLPEDSVLVFRPKAIREFAERLNPPSTARSPENVGSRERSTLLTIIGALAQIARVDLSKPSAAASAIESQTALMGARVAARTIEEHLKRVPEALETRSK